jgi:hypothetical protein
MITICKYIARQNHHHDDFEQIKTISGSVQYSTNQSQSNQIANQ